MTQKPALHQKLLNELDFTFQFSVYQIYFPQLKASLKALN